METFAYLCHATLHAENEPFDPVASQGTQPASPTKLRTGVLPMQFRLLPFALMLVLLGSVNQAMALKKGDRGPEVRALQTSLKQRGFFTGRVDGKYGVQTEQAVRRFQQANGLKADGVVGRSTLAALKRPGQGGPSLPASDQERPTQNRREQALRKGAEGKEVTALQNRLRQLGFYTGPISGKYGSLTETAVKQAQQKMGLKPDGIYGSKTAQALDQLVQKRAQSNSNPASSADKPPTNNEIAVLRLGSQGPEVAVLQERLKTAGAYQGEITGVYDAVTETAVKQFQANSNLPVDGIAGLKTQQALALFATNDSAGSKALGAASQSRPLSVLALQTQLKERGFNPGPLDGKEGTQTKAAIRAAQRYFGISEEDVRNGKF